jgi:diguanylate cyclase (GGDEF)-like protein/PAS domain S-box-containing protein
VKANHLAATRTIAPEVAALVLDRADALIAVLDEKGRVVLWNRACEEVTGRLAVQARGRQLWKLYDGDGDALRGGVDEVRYHEQEATVEAHWPRGRTEDVVIRWTFRALATTEGSIPYTVATGAVVTELRRAEDALRVSEAELAALVEALPIGYFAADIDPFEGTVTVVRGNARYREITGHDPEVDGPVEIGAFIHPDDRARVADAVAEVVEDRAETVTSVRLRHPDGSTRWVRCAAAPVTDQYGEVVAGVATLVDATTEVRALETAVHLEQIFAASTDLVGQADAVGELLYLNDAARRLLGYRPASLDEMLDTPSRLQFHQEVLPALDDTGVWRGEMAVISSDGTKVPVSQQFVVHRDGVGTIERISMIARDISEAKALQEDLSARAFTDELTGLANRALLSDRLGQALGRVCRSDQHLAVLFLDLDYFKPVNDELGHDAGDELLRLAAQRIRAAVRPADTVARIGGDEFVVLAELSDAREALRIAERVRRNLARPFTVGGTTVETSASIGVALTGDGEIEPETLLSHADRASYRAKERGRNRAEIFHEDVAPTRRPVVH